MKIKLIDKKQYAAWMQVWQAWMLSQAEKSAK